MHALILFLSGVLLLFFLLVRLPSHKNLPPGPFAWPIIGNLQAMLTKPPHVARTELGWTHGPLMLLRFGWQPIFVASTSEAAEEVLKRHDKVLAGRYVPHSLRDGAHLRHSLAWSDTTENWKGLRRLARVELFTTKMLDNQAQARERKVAELVGYVGLNQGIVMKLNDVVFGTLLNMLGQAVFSKDVFRYGEKGDTAGMQKVIREVLALMVSPNLGDYYPILGGLDLQGLSKACSMRIKQLNTLWEGHVEERRKCRNDGEKRHDFLEVLLNNCFDDAQINAMFLETFGPASETSTTTIEWTMAELIKNPDKMTKVVAELNTVVGRQEPVKESHLPQLVYLQACIKEAMRLHPAAPFLLPHRAMETCTVMGYTVPKDCQIMVNFYAIGRDPSTWKDPLTFAPERFVGSDVDYNGNHM